MLKELINHYIKLSLEEPLTNNEIASIGDIVYENLKDDVKKQIEMYIELNQEQDLDGNQSMYNGIIWNR